VGYGMSPSQTRSQPNSRFALSKLLAGIWRCRGIQLGALLPNKQGKEIDVASLNVIHRDFSKSHGEHKQHYGLHHLGGGMGMPPQAPPHGDIRSALLQHSVREGIR